MKARSIAGLILSAQLVFSFTNLIAADTVAVQDGRIDIDVKNAPENLQLTVVEASKDTVAKNGSKSSLVIWEFTPKEGEWTQINIKIKSNVECTARLRLKSKFTKEDPVWMLYDMIEVKSTQISNADFEEAPTKTNGWIMEQQVQGKGAQWVKDAKVAKSNNGFVMVWHNGPATYGNLNLSADTVVEVSVWVRKPTKEIIDAAMAAK
ncbi:MAG TPA: hypothetical protein DCZ94_22250 [Lentisphaeria bacterium]|nr:MAG: hypothetical protein A2X48_13490 [Lentisphaerae bacterium GWF2_49_21]HBC89670.1 hypothetical protein [Lentisphaeria bacterium]